MQANPVVIDLADPAYWIDPYPTLRAARARGRTTWTVAGELVVLTAAEADRIHLDPRFTTPGLRDLERGGIHDGPFYEWRARTLNVLNGEDHARLRNFVGPAFGPRRMERLRAEVAAQADAIIDRHASAGEIEIFRDYASELPLWSLCRFIGIDDADRRRIGQFLTGTEEGFVWPMNAERRRRVEESIRALNDTVSVLIERRRRSPSDDIVGLLVRQQAEGSPVSADELHSLIVNLIGGAVGSTRAGITNALLEFARHPDQAELVRRNPGVLGPAIEECLRFHPPFRFGRRVASEAVELPGLEIQAGQSIYFPRQAYNRDPERYDEPDRFDIRRPERRHSSFSVGAHFCLGAAMARVNLQIAIQAFLTRCHDIVIVNDPKRVPFVPDEQLDALHLRFRRAG